MYGFGEGGDAAGGGEFAFYLVDVRAVGGDHALTVAENHVFAADAHGDEEPRAGDGRRTGAVHYDAEFVERFAGDFRRIEQRGRRNHGRAVLVVVHHGDVQLFTQPAVDFEALRSLDVFEVDAAEGRGDGLNRADERFGVGLIDFDVESVDVCERLEQHAFAFHHGLACQSADITQSEDGGAVRNDCYQIAFVGVAIHVVGIGLDGAARGCDAGRIGQ